MRLLLNQRIIYMAKRHRSTPFARFFFALLLIIPLSVMGSMYVKNGEITKEGFFEVIRSVGKKKDQDKTVEYSSSTAEEATSPRETSTESASETASEGVDARIEALEAENNALMKDIREWKNSSDEWEAKYNEVQKKLDKINASLNE